MTTNRRDLALVTGASSGIGRDIAIVLARKKYDLVLVARREAALSEVASRLEKEHGVTAHVIAADLAAAGAADSLVEKLSTRSLTVDVLVNNAGYGLYGKVTDTDPDAELAMVQLNVVALYRLSKLLLPGMVARKRGRILNVASTAAFYSGPYMAVYFATKAFVLAFSEALDEELAGSGVTVTCLCPGPTATAFREVAGSTNSKAAERPQEPSMPVAEAGVEAMLAGERLYIPGAKNRFETSVPRLLPRRMMTRIVGRTQGGDSHS
jgi:short-subunit dehydrogenase